MVLRHSHTIACVGQSTNDGKTGKARCSGGRTESKRTNENSVLGYDMTTGHEMESPKLNADLSEEKRVTFGQNCKAARMKAGLSQSAVAEAAGIPQPRLSAIEQGKGNITLDTMVRIARVVDHDLSRLLQKPSAF